MTPKHLFLALAITLLSSGCTWTPHRVQLTATAAEVSGPRIKSEAKLHLNVLDDRDQHTVGQRGVGNIGADVSAPQIMGYLKTQVTQGFQAQGFTLVEDWATADARVTIALRSFQWQTTMGFFSGGEDVFVSLRADARNKRTDDELTRTYQYDNETRAIFVAHGAEISEKMNAGFSSVLRQLFTDVQLTRFLEAK